MGHLTRIANTVVQNLEKGHVQSQISDLIRGRSASLSLSLSLSLNQKGNQGSLSFYNPKPSPAIHTPCSQGSQCTLAQQWRLNSTHLFCMAE